MREVVEIEQQLQSSLRRIDPSQDFIDHLHSRLRTPAELHIEYRREALAIGIVIAASMLFGGAFLIWVWLMLRRPAQD